VDVLQLRSVWKRRYGFAAATFLSYLVESEPDDAEWFPAPLSTLDRRFHISPSVVAHARDKLTSDGVIRFRYLPGGYEYRIDHQRLAEIEAEKGQQ